MSPKSAPDRHGGLDAGRSEGALDDVLRPALIVTVLVIAVDQASKFWLIDVMRQNDFQTLPITSFFNLAMVWNEGISFGMLGGAASTTRWVLVVFAVLVGVALLVWSRRTTSSLLGVAAGLIAGGALGNAIDRVIYGAVADFFDVHVAGYHWPAFNIADAGITVGVVLLLYDALLRRRQDSKLSS
jgi:signal peptidase II